MAATGSHIYRGQTKLRIQVSTGIDLTNATTYIIWSNPSGTVGTWMGTVLAPATDGTMYYNIETANDLNQSGNWKFYASIIDGDGNWCPGMPFQEYIYEPGQTPN